MLKISELSYSYDGKMNVFENIDFTIQKGEIVGLTGPSGCGKSTLCHLVLALLRPSSGRIFFQNRDVFEWKKEGKLQEKIQLVMQNSETAFDPNRTLGYSLSEIGRFRKIEMKSLQEKINQGLRISHLTQDMLSRRPEELSGGQLQRFAILRALLMEPELLILDEVTSMLDPLVQARMIHLLQELKALFDLTYLVISHDLLLLKHFCNRSISLESAKDGTFKDGKRGGGIRFEEFSCYETKKAEGRRLHERIRWRY